MKSLVHRAFRALGYELVRSRRHASAAQQFATATPQFQALSQEILPYTMTSVPRLLAMYSAAQYVARAGVPGAIVECGVWRGGSMMMAAGALLELDTQDRDLYLFDTFEGMPPAGDMDVSRSGEQAEALLRSQDRNDPNSIWCVADIEDVRTNMRRTGYPEDRIHLIRGVVEETIPRHAPNQVALLRLDTDWYESTRHELMHLYPRVSPGGVLMIDDFGHWRGARRAVLEYFADQDKPVFLVSLDDTGVCSVVI